MQSLASMVRRIRLRSSRGFTMIELLIVITILGILAVAVLSAINPVEQINRGRDTGTRSDAEQLLSAIDRYNAFKGYFPWMENANDPALGVDDGGGVGAGLPVAITTTEPLVHNADCHILNTLSGGSVASGIAYPLANSAGCVAGSDEVKSSFITRLTNVSGSSRQMYIYNRGKQGDSTYVCFVPQSNAFRTEAEARCRGPVSTDDYTAAAGMPADLSDTAKSFICGGASALSQNTNKAMTCLP